MLLKILKENCCAVQITNCCMWQTKILSSFLAARAELHIQHNKVSYID